MLNVKVRFKNPYFWVSLLGVVLTAMRVSPESLTSWVAVGESLYALITNPCMIISVAISILGVIMDPTTKGLEDSLQAMEYDKPKENK